MNELFSNKDIKIIYKIIKKENINRTKEEKNILIMYLIKFIFFKNLDHNEIIFLCKIIEYRLYEKDSIIIKEKDVGDEIYFILKGEVNIMKQKQNKQNYFNEKYFLKTLYPGESFGEFSIFYNCKRSAFSIAKTLCIVLVLNREFLKGIKFDNFKIALKNNLEILKYLNIFENKNNMVFQNLMSISILKKLSSNSIWFKEGEYTNQIWIINTGIVKIVKKLKYELNNDNKPIYNNYEEPKSDKKIDSIQLKICELGPRNILCYDFAENNKKVEYTAISTTPCEIILILFDDLKIFLNGTESKNELFFIESSKILKEKYFKKAVLKNIKNSILKNIKK